MSANSRSFKHLAQAKHTLQQNTSAGGERKDGQGLEDECEDRRISSSQAGRKRNFDEAIADEMRNNCEDAAATGKHDLRPGALFNSSAEAYLDAEVNNWLRKETFDNVAARETDHSSTVDKDVVVEPKESGPHYLDIRQPSWPLKAQQGPLSAGSVREEKESFLASLNLLKGPVRATRIRATALDLWPELL